MLRIKIARCSRRVSTEMPKRYNSNIPPSHASPAEAVTEDFSSPVWRRTLILGVALYATYKFDQVWAGKHDGQGYFAGVIDYWRPQEGLWEARNISHFDLATEAAEARLLLQSARKPIVRQLRYPAALDQGSPWNIRVDQLVDNSKVKVKRHDQVATAGVEDSV